MLAKTPLICRYRRVYCAHCITPHSIEAMDDVSTGNLTPGTLQALVEDNVRHYEMILSRHESAELKAWHRQAVMTQDIIADLRRQPNAPLHNAHLESDVRYALKQWVTEVEKARQALDAIEQDITRLVGEFRPLLATREQQLLQLWRQHLEHPDFSDYLQRLGPLNNEHARLSESQARLARERDEKMPAYERNDLYVYLRGRRYGTDDYTCKGLSRTLDDWLANKINYRENRRNELILRSMPDALNELIGECANKIQALEQLNSTSWSTRLDKLKRNPDGLRFSLLVKQIIAAKSHANDAYAKLNNFFAEEDELGNNAEQWMDEQIDAEDLYQALEILIERHPDKRQVFDRHRDALNAVNDALEASIERADQAMDDYLHAKALEWTLRDLRSADGTCDPSCNCDCHHALVNDDHEEEEEEEEEEAQAQCPCLYNAERFYSYPASLHFPDLIESYMKRNLTAADLLEVFDTQRQWFIDAEWAQPTSINAASAPPNSTQSLTS